MTLRRTCVCIIALVLTSVPAYPQNRPDPPYRWNLGFAILRQGDVVGGFSSQICPGNEYAVEGGLGLHVSKWLATSFFTRAHDEFFAEKCADGFIPPPPDSGVVVYQDYSDVRGYPYVSSGIRFTFSVASDEGALYRAYGGAEWLWEKSVFAPLFGFGIAIPTNDLLVIAELERRLLRVPYDSLEVTYRGGLPVSQERAERRSKEYRWPIRLGIEYRFGNRR